MVQNNQKIIFFTVFVICLSLLIIPWSESVDLPSQASSNANPGGNSDNTEGTSSADRSAGQSSSSQPPESRDDSSAETRAKESPAPSDGVKDSISRTAESSSTDVTTDDGTDSDLETQSISDHNTKSEKEQESTSSSKSVPVLSTSSEPKSEPRSSIKSRAPQRPITIDIRSKRNSSEARPRENMTVSVQIPKNTSIRKVTYMSNHPAVQALLNREVLIQEGQYQEDTRIDRNVKLPAFAPAGNHTIEAAIETESENGSRSIQRINVTANVRQEKGLTGLMQRALPHLSSDAYAEVFSEVDSREKQYLPPSRNASRASQIRSIQQTHTRDDLETLRSQSDPRVQRTADELEQKESMLVNKTIESYNLSDENGTESIVSRIILTVRAPQSMKNISIVEVIPKSIAEDVSELELYGPVEIVQEDPIVRWNFDYAQKDEEIQIGYEVRGSVEPDQTQTLSGSESVSRDARFISFLINGGWFVIVVSGILLLVVLPTSAYVYRKKRRLQSYAK